jgi:hypothetical protein
VLNDHLPAQLEQYTPQQLQTVVVAFNKLGVSNPQVAAAAVRLSQVLPHLTPEFPDAAEEVGAQLQQPRAA